MNSKLGRFLKSYTKQILKKTAKNKTKIVKKIIDSYNQESWKNVMSLRPRMRPTAAEVTSSSAPKSEPAADEVADTLAPAQKKN